MFCLVQIGLQDYLLQYILRRIIYAGLQILHHLGLHIDLLFYIIGMIINQHRKGSAAQ